MKKIIAWDNAAILQSDLLTIANILIESTQRMTLDLFVDYGTDRTAAAAQIDCIYNNLALVRRTLNVIQKTEKEDQ